MSPAVSCAFLTRAIERQRFALFFMLGAAVFVVLLGIATIVLAPRIAATLLTGQTTVVFTIGGGFVSSLSTFPLKESFARWDRIALLELLRTEYEQISRQTSGFSDSARLERLDSRFWEIVNKISGG